MRHPAPFTPTIIDVLRNIVAGEHITTGRTLRVLDPFAGTGRIHRLADHHIETVGVELEPEWAAADHRTIVGDATALPFADDSFDVLCTSPCLEQSHRVLTDDLRWVPVGDIQVGDNLLAFEEHGRPNATGNNARRRWQRTEVVRSVPRRVECVRVILSNGDELITTPEHPWLATRYAYAGTGMEWVPSNHLLGSPGIGRAGKGRRQPYHVLRQVAPWTERRTRDAGWLAGMFDGEGSLSLGVHGSPKMQVCQVVGPVADRMESLMSEFGYSPNRILRTDCPGKQMVNLYVTDGFPGMLRALGELRPMRLLEKWSQLDVSTRTVQAERIEVKAVEPAGMQDIQEIETTSGTYIGEGYLHHNCYGNRMSDHHEARDDSRRNTYRHAIGRPLHANNAGAMQWTNPAYKELHAKAWSEAYRVVKPHGLFVINVSNHIRRGVEQNVVEWHLSWFLEMGCRVQSVEQVHTPRQRFGKNGDLRVDSEKVLVLRAP